MKKIVGILAAAAVAASAFAADLSAGVRLAGDLFNYNGDTGAVQALKLNNENQPWQAPLTLSISSDRAGGTFKFWDGTSSSFTTGKWAIWFKPTDALKVNLGTIDKSMNVETIDYGGRLINYDNWGASLDVNVDAFSMTLSAVVDNGKYWFTDGTVERAAAADAAYKKAYDEAYATYIKNNAAEPAYPTEAEKTAADTAAKAAGNAAKQAALDGAKTAATAELNFYAQYAADFGTISAMFDAKDTFKTLAFGVGYKNTFDPVTIFVDAAFYKGKTNGIGADFDIVFAQDALNIQAYAKWTADDITNINMSTMTLLALAKFSYTLDKGTVYLYFKDADILESSFGCTIKPGFTSSVGIMAYEIAAQFDIASSVKISVPVNFKVNF